MSKNTSPRFVTATCKCGNQFDREVKRGRPQIWCPACVLVPFYDRTAVVVPVVLSATGEVVVVPDRIVNINDPLDAVRAEIEVEIAEINAEHKQFFADLVEAGMDPYEAGPVVSAASAARMTATYAKYR